MKKIFWSIASALMGFPAALAACEIAGPGNYCYEMNSLGQIKIRGWSGTDIFIESISALWFYGAALIGIIAVFMIVIAGSMFITGGEKLIARGRKIFGMTIVALVIYFGFGALFQAVAPLWFTYRGIENYGDAAKGQVENQLNNMQDQAGDLIEGASGVLGSTD